MIFAKDFMKIALLFILCFSQVLFTMDTSQITTIMYENQGGYLAIYRAICKNQSQLHASCHVKGNLVGRYDSFYVSYPGGGHTRLADGQHYFQMLFRLYIKQEQKKDVRTSR